MLELLDQPEVIDGSADTGWIDRVREQGRLVSHKHSAVALAAAAIEAYEEEELTERQRLLSTAFGGRPQVRHESGTPLDLKLRGATYRVRVARVGARRFRVSIEAGHLLRTADVELERFDEHTGRITVNGERHRVLTGAHGAILLVEVDSVTHRISRDEGGVLRSPMPALVIATPLEAGAEVEAGAPVLVLEAMKMEAVIRAPFKARVKEVAVTVGAKVDSGAPLLRLEPIGDAEAEAEQAAGDAEIDLPEAPASPSGGRRVAVGQEDLRSLLLGFDVDPLDERRVLADYLAAASGETHRPLGGEVELIEVFADLAELSRNRSAGEDGPGDTHVHSAREFFHAYLQSLDVERAGLPESFQARLSKALGHYGVKELERTPELEAAVFRIFLAQQRASGDASVIAALLRAWLQSSPPDESLREPAGLALERLIAATQVRYPALADLARGVVFSWFGQPLLLRNRARVYSGIRKHLRHLDLEPASPDRGDRIAEMVPQHRAPGPAARPAPGPRQPRQLGPARGADPPLLRQQGAHRAPHVGSVRRRRAGRVVDRVHGRPVRPAGRGARRARRPGRRRRDRRRRLPVLGGPAGRPRRDGGRADRGGRRPPAARAGTPAHHHGRGPRRRGHAPPLHVPSVQRRDGPRSG